MNLIQRINTGVSIIVLAVCALVFLVFGWSATGWKALTIPTGSMRPNIPPGSLVLVHRVPDSSLKIGDVITYTNPMHPTTTLSHRIVKEYSAGGSETFVTKGDANRYDDVPIAGNKILGKVVWHKINVGYWISEVKKPIVILPIIYFAALFIMIEESQRLRDYFKQSVPYRAYGFAGHFKKPNVITRWAGQTVMLTAILVVVGTAVSSSAVSALRSNTVILTGNIISTTLSTPPPTTCWGNNKNTVTINNTTTQTGSSGNVLVSGNKGNTGNVSSGSVSNNNTTTITINQGNGC